MKQRFSNLVAQKIRNYESFRVSNSTKQKNEKTFKAKTNKLKKYFELAT